MSEVLKACDEILRDYESGVMDAAGTIEDLVALIDASRTPAAATEETIGNILRDDPVCQGRVSSDTVRALCELVGPVADEGVVAAVTNAVWDTVQGMRAEMSFAEAEDIARAAISAMARDVRGDARDD